MRFFVGVAAAFGAGLLIGTGFGMLLIEEQTKKKYEESMASHKRALEMSHEKDRDTNESLKDKEFPGTVEEFAEGVGGEGGVLLGEDETVQVVKTQGETHDFAPLSLNPYHTAVDDPNDTRPSFMYITEEDYHADDERAKNKVDIVMDEPPMFFENGGEMRDWEYKIGSHILRDLYTMCPPGAKPVLYVRNLQTDEDYEVSRENP